ncbi:hypothetical protein MBM_00405 [Drepanopeziza brunnea f. sp. 'multigermtubi' MB_m1]|uniref:Uncharacterized protein n=1 Tax=Marssonina brunnea f. sp. multigermtubi (strain MB_m1) TaxID=1072389 RepID=K1X8A8_MARBU|nr:uncharacterized protein MBM_00405 [Drepanopeziza brunnea f. sp. 'multigermtubi' MB_m1]EKD21292.1 hypothetical protein MBM_00405 [Drepanopeziza brunnea f. sp. 'multigermtubi' MB_m1]
MQYPSAFIAIFAATAVLSLPLNINMGAYSPALVVGDGAIGFEGANGADQVANLMNTLLGASNTGTAGNPNAAALPPAAAPPAAPAKPTPSAPAAGEVAAESLPQGMGKVSTAEEGQDLGAQIDDVDHYTFDKRAAAKRDLTGFKAALAYSMNALMAGPEVQLGTGAHGSGVGIIQKAGGSKTAPSGGGTH